MSRTLITLTTWFWMIMKTTIFFLLCLSFVLTFGKPYSNTEETNIFCYGAPCPKSTKHCKKEVRTMKDLRLIRTRIYCKDIHSNIVDIHISDDYNYREGYTVHSDALTGIVTNMNIF